MQMWSYRSSLYKLCELNPKNIALAIEAAKATAQRTLCMTTITNEEPEKSEAEGVTTN